MNQSHLEMSDTVKIAVIGAGVVGLSVAYQLTQQYGSRVDVTVVAETFIQQTTSFGTAGLWEPYAIAGKELPRYYHQFLIIEFRYS